MGRAIKYCKLCRREKEKLFLKGDKCMGAKCPINKRNYPPGQHGAKVVRPTEYGKRLREKQKARRIYGIGERQFEKYFDIAAASKGSTGDTLLQLLERRLDNVVFRLGYASSRSEARQLVGHGHVKVNGKKVNIPSFQVKANNEIVIAEKFVLKLKEKLEEYTPPSWLELQVEPACGKVLHIPEPGETDRMIETSLVVEYYSR